MQKDDLFSQLGVKIIKNAFDETFCDNIKNEMFDSYLKEEIELKDIELRRTFKHELSENLKEVILNKINKEIKPELESFFGLDLKFSKPIQALIYNKGHFFKPHKDDTKTEDGSTYRKLTTVFFLNNQGSDSEGSNYQGGLLNLYGLVDNFPNKGFPVPNKKGNMVAFKADTIHEVTNIIDGQRISLVVWFE